MASTSATPSSQPKPVSQPPKSPSPPPEPHIQLTPGHRAAAFMTLYSKTLDATLNSISYDAFAACFPDIAERAPAALRLFHGQFVERLGGMAQAEFEDILKERNVVHNLNKLEDIIASARYRKAQSPAPEIDQIPPHTQTASSLLKAHLGPHLASQRSLLNAKLQTTESQNAQLLRNIQRQREEIEKLVTGLEGFVGDLEDAREELGQKGEELGMEARSAEAMLR